MVSEIGEHGLARLAACAMRDPLLRHFDAFLTLSTDPAITRARLCLLAKYGTLGETAVRTTISRGFQTTAIALLFAFGQGFHEHPAEAQSASFSNAKEWLDQAVREKHCPLTPVNVPRTILKTTSNDVLQQRTTIAQDTLQIEGTPDPNHIVIKTGESPGVVRVVFDGKDLGSFGPVARIVVQGGAGSDVMVVEPDVDLPTVLHAGFGDSCLQAGSGADLLFGGPGNDVLITGTGRPALDAGPGVNRVGVPQSMGELWVAPSAKGELLRQIGTLYTLQPLPHVTGEPAQGGPSPIILGPADLADASIIPLLQQAYAAGQAIAITNATNEDGARLRALLGHPNAAESPSTGEKGDLIFFRKAPRTGTETNDYSTGIFHHLAHTERLAGGRQPDEFTIESLSRVFSAGAIVPQARNDTPANDITNLADSHTFTAKQKDDSGFQVQVTDSVWGVRSFQNQTDFYYVQQTAKYEVGLPGVVLEAFADSQIDAPLVPPTIIQASPQTTQCMETTGSSVDYSIAGSAGWNATQGLNAALTGGVAISNSQSITCPQITILYAPNLSTGFLFWQYTTPPAEGTISFLNQWIWEVPFNSYSNDQKEISISSEGHLQWSPPFNHEILGTLIAGRTSSVPLPFGDTFVLQNPMVLNVNPACVLPGSTFTINGTGMYPSLVTGIAIGGTPLTTSQYSKMSDTLLQVIAPDQPSEAPQPVVVQTALGLSNSNVTIEIPYFFCD
jgi:Ca2+-binding RTX toxin-like protein